MNAKHLDLISPIRYNRMSEKYGEYKVVEFLGFKGKTNVEYYKIKFKDTGNCVPVNVKTILKNKVIDIVKKKKNTKKNNKDKKKEEKEKREWEVKYLHKPKNILCLDLASQSTGYCACSNGKIVEYDYIYHSKNKNNSNDLIVRLNYMKNKIIEKIKEHSIDAVAIEAIPFMGSKHVLFVLAQIRILVLDYCFENNIQWISVNPQSWEFYSWKNRFKGKDTKEKNYLSAKIDYEVDFKELFKGKNNEEIKKEVWQDVCDSFLLCKYVVQKRCV